MSDLRKNLIKLAYEKKELRDDLLPLVKTGSFGKKRKVLKVNPQDRGKWYDVPERPDKVWRWNSHKTPTEDDIPIYHQNAQIEDYGNDWQWRAGKFKYSGSGHGDKTEQYLILEYETSEEKECSECGKTLPVDARFCSACGNRM